ncbi:MAG: shikimate dehydrogenase [Candidatus Margulisiibacteriota bacterium]
MKNITGLFGHPVKHSLSPQMHNAAFKNLGMDNWEYQLFDVPQGELGHYIQKIKDEGIIGVNVTVPYKVDVMEYLDDIDPLAEKIGAVNTVKNENGKLLGYNTDAPGFYESLFEDAGFPEERDDKTVLLLGAGGAARALISILIDKREFEELYIHDFIINKAKKLIEEISVPGEIRIHEIEVNTTTDELDKYARQSVLILNATGLGSSHNVGASPLSAEAFNNGQWVYDLGYNPPETEMLRLAKDAGAHTCNGLGMLVRQGALAFEIFTGVKPSVEVMRNAVS